MSIDDYLMQVPPDHMESEQAVLGALMFNAKLYSQIASQLSLLRKIEGLVR